MCLDDFTHTRRDFLKLSALLTAGGALPLLNSLNARAAAEPNAVACRPVSVSNTSNACSTRCAADIARTPTLAVFAAVVTLTRSNCSQALLAS